MFILNYYYITLTQQYNITDPTSGAECYIFFKFVTIQNTNFYSFYTK